MINREEAKMFFDNDLEVLGKAYEADAELLEIINTTITIYVSKTFEVLIKKGLITENEALEYLKEANELLRIKQEENKKNEVKKDGFRS